MRSRWECTRAALVVVALAAGGCGLGAGRTPGRVTLTVTSDFGRTAVGRWDAPRVRGQETAMSLLMRNAHVTTRYGGGFVQSIDGRAGEQAGGRPVDWFYYVNGSEAPRGAAGTRVHPGDAIWWDRHDWSETDHIPAVVGSFPEPFRDGLGGKRLPVRVECEAAATRPCRLVTARLRVAGAPAAGAALGTGAAPHTLRVLVGTWSRLARDPVASAIARGPAASGVYARFASGGAALSVLDQDGAVVSRLGAGSGLIAATASGEDAPVWVVTGTDPRGVVAAARAFRQDSLRDRFALAVGRTGTAIALPPR